MYTFYTDSRPEFVTHVPCFSGDPVRWCTGALEFAEGAKKHLFRSRYPTSPVSQGILCAGAQERYWEC